MEAFGQGQEIHMQAAPSQAELLYKQFREKKEKLTGNTRAAIMDKYGDAASKEKPPEGLLMGQTEKYVEYDRAGRVVKGGGTRRRQVSVRGGRARAESQGGVGLVVVRGAVGVRVLSQHPARELTPAPRVSKPPRRPRISSAKIWRLGKLRWRDATKSCCGGARGEPKNPFERKRDVWGEKEEGEDVNLNPEKLMEALRKEDKRLRGDGEGQGDEKKRGYNVTHEEEEPTEGDGGTHEAAEEGGSMAAPDGGTEGYDLV